MSQKAFSLVELSIVLIIIGLLVSGISAGSKLIEAAKVNGLMQDVAEYKESYMTFKTTYDAAPGDFKEAESFWGASTTDNGDGNGIISHATQNYIAFDGNSESNRAPHHMSLAGLLSGISSGSGISSIDSNVHTTKYKNQSIIFYQGYNPSNTAILSKIQLTSDEPNFVTVQGESQASGFNSAYFPSIKTINAYNIDKKYDDGKPFTGAIFSTKGSEHTSSGRNVSNQCASQEIGSTSKAEHADQTYNITAPTNLCHMFFSIGGNFSFK